MFCRVITLRFNPVLDGFDDQPLRELLAHWEVISINDHFFEQQGIAYLSLVKARPQSLAALRMIDGFGDAKIKKYGRAMEVEQKAFLLLKKSLLLPGLRVVP